MKPQCILISLLVNLAYAEEYLVRFKNPTAFQQFTSNSNRSWRQFIDNKIEKKFSIGSFRGVTMNLSKNLVNKLKKSPLVADIVPNFRFEAFEGDSVNSAESSYTFNATAKYSYEDVEEEQNITYQPDAPRHLARISRHYQLPFDVGDKDRYKKLVQLLL
ncbi:CFS_G0006500.mRNA.1.CDS.1 [Saccharomyces cerevisiae]|nr:CFS_G0006500.mRNA.1.CDS.1 [Saccharomyces cerevisiae]CAI7174355.1 CFS_G0006500.mRNA.1.CDS.1 [Saccharomyces cerevisiae]